MKHIFILLLLTFSCALNAQSEVLKFKNNDIIIEAPIKFQHNYALIDARTMTHESAANTWDGKAIIALVLISLGGVSIYLRRLECKDFVE